VQFLQPPVDHYLVYLSLKSSSYNTICTHKYKQHIETKKFFLKNFILPAGSGAQKNNPLLERVTGRALSGYPKNLPGAISP